MFNKLNKLKKVVLVVDKSVLIIESLQNILSHSLDDVLIYGAVGYADTLRFCNTVIPDVILLDSGLPHDMATEILEMLQQKKYKTKIIMLANNNTECMKIKFGAFGADYFLDKFYDFEKIPALVRKFAKQRLMLL